MSVFTDMPSLAAACLTLNNASSGSGFVCLAAFFDGVEADCVVQLIATIFRSGLGVGEGAGLVTGFAFGFLRRIAIALTPSAYS
jgi:hypothetical protein